jgi:hypothetical protein
MPIATPDIPIAIPAIPTSTPDTPIADDIAALKDALTDFYVFCSTKAETDEKLADAITKTASAAVATALYAFNNSDPAGFNLYKSTDGVNFEPVVVDGFENKYNYGGRVLLATKYGTFVTTANPFDGGQVWRIEDLEPTITLNIPKNITLELGESKTFSVLAVDMPEEALLELFTEQFGELADFELIKRETSSVVTDHHYDVKIEFDATAYGLKKYVSTHSTSEHTAQMYDFILTGMTPGRSKTVVSVNDEAGLSSNGIFNLTVLHETPIEYILGDANGDGDFGVDDATYVQKVLAKLESSSELYELAADVNWDGEVSISDATDMQKKLAKFADPDLNLIGTSMLG